MYHSLHITMDFSYKFRLGASTTSDKNLKGFCSISIYYLILVFMSTISIMFLKIFYDLDYCFAEQYTL